MPNDVLGGASGGDILPHLGGTGGGGGGVTGSSDSSLTIAGADAIINRATAGAWTAAHSFTVAGALALTAMWTDGASTAASVEAMRVARQSSVTGVAGNGVHLAFFATNDTPAAAEAGRVRVLMRAVVTGSEGGAICLDAMNNGSETLCGWGTAGQWYAPTLALGSLSAAGVTTQTAQISIVSTFVEYKSNNASQGGHKFIGTANVSGARGFFAIAPSSNTGITASTAVPVFDYQTHTMTWATGAGPGEQIEFKIAAPTYAAAGASTFPIASTVAITGAPIAGTNMTITKPLAFHVQSGGSQFDGNVGFYGVAPAAQGVSGYAATNNVAVGGTDGTIANYTDLSVYANDAATIRNNIYQLAKMVKQHHDWLRAAGPLT